MLSPLAHYGAAAKSLTNVTIAKQVWRVRRCLHVLLMCHGGDSHKIMEATKLWNDLPRLKRRGSRRNQTHSKKKERSLLNENTSQNFYQTMESSTKERNSIVLFPYLKVCGDTLGQALQEPRGHRSTVVKVGELRPADRAIHP